MMQKRTYFTIKDFLVMTAPAALGGATSTNVSTLGDLRQSMFGFTGITQWAPGLFVLWLILAVGLTRKQDAGSYPTIRVAAGIGQRSGR